MPENDSKHTPRERKHKDRPPPLLVPGVVYRYEDLIPLFGCSKATVQEMRSNGLQAYKPGTGIQLVFSDDLIAFIRRFPVKPEGQQ